MLSEEVKRKIEKETRIYPTKQAACIEALTTVQREQGWVDDAALTEIAGLLEMTPDELDGVATFYNLVFRRRVGRHVILVCNSVSCWVMGYDSIRAHLEQTLGIRLGETTADGRFTLLPIVCLGACDHAPAMMIDLELHGDLTAEKVDAILARYV
ncbi:MAG: NADH-quinone oxidoreductase subunit NuoE [Candidatus Hydrogenedentes bacterium]|nr:NADH-quinone oxidoreductase subunit NuoE [Candidatus Hydrogenedentota bacterium]